MRKPKRTAPLALLLVLLLLPIPQVAGLPTNVPYLQRLAAHPAFAAMDLDTAFVVGSVGIPSLQQDCEHLIFIHVKLHLKHLSWLPCMCAHAPWWIGYQRACEMA